jgi:hypothetical protein
MTTDQAAAPTFDIQNSLFNIDSNNLQITSMDDRFDDDDTDDWDDAASETVACPACGAEVYAEAICCPACGEYVTHSTSLFAGRPWWWVALGVAGVIAVIVTSLVLGWGQ